MRAQRRRSNHRIYTLPLRNLIPKCRNLGIGRRCRGRWLSSNRNSSRTAAHGVGGKTQSAEPGPCKGWMFPAGGVGRRVLGWSWCSPPLRWTTKRTGSLPMPTKIGIWASAQSRVRAKRIGAEIRRLSIACRETCLDALRKTLGHLTRVAHATASRGLCPNPTGSRFSVLSSTPRATLPEAGSVGP